jgi:hypothetical protein
MDRFSLYVKSKELGLIRRKAKRLGYSVSRLMVFAALNYEPTVKLVNAENASDENTWNIEKTDQDKRSGGRNESTAVSRK